MKSPRVQMLQESIQKLLRRGAPSRVERLLMKSRSADVAVVMRYLDDRHQLQIFSLLKDDEARADVLTEVDRHVAAGLLAGRPVEELVRYARLMSGDDLADLVVVLPEAVQRQLMEAFKPHEAEEVEDLLNYGEDTAGGIMSPDFFALSENTSASGAIKALQHSTDVEMAFYIYVVNDPGHLVGVVSLRALLTNAPDTLLSEIMVSDVIVVNEDTDQEEVARLAARYNLLAIPVVNDGLQLVGIVTIDDVIDVIRDEATEDILKMAGASEAALEGTSIAHNVKQRAPWLFATWMGGLAASLLIGAFEEHLQARVALAAFIPIVLGMGGNVGAQTATIIVRGLATGRVGTGLGWRYLSREAGIGVSLGVIYGSLLAVYALLRDQDSGNPLWSLPLTVGLSIFASMSIAAVVGAVTPLVFERLNIDPAVATGPIVTTTVDVLGILVYFMVAMFIGGM